MVAAYKYFILRHGAFVEEVDEQVEQVVQVEQEEFSGDVDFDHEIDRSLSFGDECEQIFAERLQTAVRAFLRDSGETCPDQGSENCQDL
ncbi:hypothetical protein RvY_02837 [Ramazzottius varieornatus]|uniref:Uncharacterized protein n=1 Tax=Ramazzottius varieornatus TaxID=947166 RepID=A0A1D1UPH6_RAMVA|nr:hypothetical protein RvY_02837 [Ramazzottius varieornatus]